MQLLKNLLLRGAHGPRGTVPAPVERLSLLQIKAQLLLILLDCEGDALTPGVAYRLKMAHSVTDLWMMRAAIYHCVARTHGQQEASARINLLLPCFEGWLPPTQLVAV